MPNYGSGTNGSPIAIAPGDRVALFAAESPTAPQASVAICPFPNFVGGPPRSLVFTISWAAAPTTAVLQIQGANDDLDASYNANVLHTTTNTQNDFYADLGQFAFYRAKLVSQSAGGAVTVEVH